MTSNIWGTKFKINGVASYLPQDLGQVLYKTSLLHLQPRQMTITILELGSDLTPQDHDPSYNPNNFGESDDEYISGMSFNCAFVFCVVKKICHFEIHKVCKIMLI